MAPVAAPTLKFKSVPRHTGVLLVGEGVAGVAFTTTVVLPVSLTQPEMLATTEYTPESAKVILLTKGFCKVEVKPFGPVQL